MKITNGQRRTVPGWVDGLVEGVEPSQLEAGQGLGRGIVRSATNFFATRAGRLAIRGGSEVVRTLKEPGGANISKMLALLAYSQTGAVAVGHHAGTSKHFLWRLTSTLDFFSGVEGTSRHDLTWGAASAARPVLAELFEKLYLVDATEDYSVRQPFTEVDSAGVVTVPTYDLDGDGGTAAAAIKAYCIAAFNSVLFVAGYDSEAVGAGRAPHLVRHSFLGVKPSLANGFDKDAYNTIGSQGLAVRAMCPGKTVLLIAKDNELHKLTGSGKALPGWQYAVQQVDNSKGFGVANPYALCHRAGLWYGVGQAGPFVSDAATVDPLAGYRAQSWKNVQRLDTAFVVEHPNREAILFGFNMAGYSGRSAQFPFILWVWDCVREAWSGDLDFGVNLAYVQPISPISTLTSTGPITAPGAPTIDDASATTSGVAGTASLGDATAKTEVRYRVSGSGALFSVGALLDPGVTAFVITGLSPFTHYEIQCAHVKAGIYSAPSASADAHTALTPPALTAWGGGGLPERVFLRWQQNAGGTQLLIERKLASDPDINYAQVLDEGIQAAGLGTDVDNPACGSTYRYRARSYEASWPAVLQYSAYGINEHDALACGSEADPGGP